MSAPLLLDQSLGAYYKAVVFDNSDGSDVVTDLRSMIDRVPGVKEVAQARLVELETLARKTGADIERRCFVSAKQLQCLRQALA